VSRRHRHTPDLLRVGLEEGPEEAAAEPVRDPLLERVFLPVGEELPLEVARRDREGLPRTQPLQRVPRLQRIVEEAAPVVDAGEPRAPQEVRSEDVAPDLLDGRRLGEEPVASYVEMEALVNGGTSEPADVPALLEHHGGHARTGRLVGGGQSGRPGTDDHEMSCARASRVERLNFRQEGPRTRNFD
jgi:hypothetical protein